MTVTHPFGAAIEAGDEERALATLAADVVFRSPAVLSPYTRASDRRASCSMQSRRVFENFRYTNEWRDGSTTILFFEANVGDRELQGVDILEDERRRRSQTLTVMIRPLSGLQALAQAMQAGSAPADRGYNCAARGCSSVG